MSEDHPHNEDQNSDGSNEGVPKEYRLVPVDDWQESEKRDVKKQQIDLRAYANTTWNHRWFIAKVTAVFVVIGVLIALLSPVEYRTEATLLPEIENSSSGAQGLIEQYGGLLELGGGNLNLNQQESLSPELYPDVVNSFPYQLELMNKPVHFVDYDTTVTSYTFFDEIYAPSLFGYIKQYTIGLPGKIIGLFKEEESTEPLPQGFTADSVITLNKQQTALVDEMRERVTVNLNDDNGTIMLSVKMPDANATTELGAMSIELLKEYITNYRIQKAEEDLKFTREQMLKAKQDWIAAQSRLAEFRDQNVGQQTQKMQAQEQRLQSEYNLTFNKYNSLAQQVEQAKLRVQEKTPVVTVLKPIQHPVDNYEPKRKLIVVIALILGVLISVGYIITRKILSSTEHSSHSFL